MSGPVVLILGSGPDVTRAARWPRAPFDHLVAINNAHAVRPDWDVHIFPEDFEALRAAPLRAGQRLVRAADYVPVQNAFGGFVFAGGTMAFTAGYWALGALEPRVIAVIGCDMVYPSVGRTHFYGTGRPDPLREDISLRSLEAKSARLMVMAAERGCACVNLSRDASRLVWPRAEPDALDMVRPRPFDREGAEEARAREATLGYVVPSGRYWEEADRFDPAALDEIDALWLAAAGL